MGFHVLLQRIFPPLGTEYVSLALIGRFFTSQPPGKLKVSGLPKSYSSDILRKTPNELLGQPDGFQKVAGRVLYLLVHPGNRWDPGKPSGASASLIPSRWSELESTSLTVSAAVLLAVGSSLSLRSALARLAGAAGWKSKWRLG